MKYGYSIGAEDRVRKTVLTTAIQNSSIEEVRNSLLKLKKYIPVLCSQQGTKEYIHVLMTILENDIQFCNCY